jgi:hypothetical protein
MKERIASPAAIVAGVLMLLLAGSMVERLPMFRPLGMTCPPRMYPA